MTTIAWDVRIVQGSSTLVSLNTAPIKLIDINLTAPRSEIIRQRTSGREDHIRRVRKRPVVGNMSVAVTDGSVANNLEELEKIKRAFMLAEEAQELDDRDRIFLEIQKGNAGDWYRSEIITGRVQEDPTTMMTDWTKDITTARILFTRRPFFEKTSGDTITIVNGAGSGTTAAINNHDDGGHDNWVTVAAAQLEGDMAVHPEIALRAQDAGVTIRRVYLGILRGDPDNVVFLEAEDGVNVGGISTDGADANCSNGNYVTSTWGTGADTKLFTLTIAAAHAEDLGGRWCKMMTRFQAAVGASPPKIRFKLLYGSNVLWEGEQLQLHASDILQDLGDIKLPPWEQEGSSSESPDLSLEVWGQKSGGGTVKIDYIFPMPKDSFRFYEPIAGGLYYSSDEAWLYDTPEEGAFTQYGGAAGTAGVVPNYVASGEPLVLLSNVDTKWWWLWDRSDASSPVDDAATVKLVVKHRRATL